MSTQELIEQTKQIDIHDLIGRYVSLSKVSGNEWQGACPKCGGDDRLHCTAEWWFCRQCHPQRADAIGFMRWLNGCDFATAVATLTNQELSYGAPVSSRNIGVGDAGTRENLKKPEDRPESWYTDAGALLGQYQAALQVDGNPGAAYLRGRSLHLATWLVFGLGYNPALQAIAMPWFRGGRITAIRYRLLHPTGKQKITSLAGSRYSGVLFGGQALPEWVAMPLTEGEKAGERYCTLILCEGEINAMSIWQVAHSSNVHVVSVGSETARLPSNAIAFAQRYGKVIIWMDKEELVKQVMERVPGVFGYSSPAGQDANDLLQAGKLGAVITSLRWQAAQSDEEKHRLYFDLFDAAAYGELDTSTAAAFEKIAQHMGKGR